MKRSLLTAMAFALLIVTGPRQVHAAPIIDVGPFDSSTSPFVVPVQVTGAVNLINWQFDLFFDPTDFQINTGCDPFTDSFCDLIFGPVTEGPFTKGPFSLFIPGVIDNIGGALTIVAGASGDALGSTGDGILAYVEFIKIGNGDSKITIGNVSTTSVPEPMSLLLLTGGLALLRGRGLIKRRGRTNV